MESINSTERFKIILDCINKLPEFNGNTNLLIDFLDRVDSLSVVVATFDVNTQTLLLGYIKDKIVGKAKLELQKHEKCSSAKIIDQLRTARVQSNIEDFYQKINHLLSRLNNSYLLDGNQSDEGIITSNKRIALEAFKNNLPEPTKSIVLSRNPKTLYEAYKVITEINHQSFGPNSTGSNQFSRQMNRNSSFNSNRVNNNSSFNSNRVNNTSSFSTNRNNSNSRYNNNSDNTYLRNNGYSRNRQQNNNSSLNFNPRSENRQQTNNNTLNFNNRSENRQNNNFGTNQSSQRLNDSSNQTRRSNRSNNNNNGYEQMDVSFNEANTEPINYPNINQNQNFSPSRPDDYLI
ncbi:putative uncharacterized protein DDB_G0286901 [Episyrphus balteatus]|uniref:putative uncharacterized protein DDB_G0286901 n=1 Tax=Episyrphus balteatus TaxID=286459 RepID=UPI002485F798|nr:putative uncharacterized protein DDB_G0286901 [Episyrphus balteatus]